MRSARLSCVIATTPRAGGFELGVSLAAAGAIGTPRPYFDPLQAPKRSSNWGILGSDRGFAGRYLSKVRVRATGPSGVCSVLLTWPDLQWMVRMARAAAGDEATRVLDSDAVASWFPDPRYVFVVCRDRGAQALDWYLSVHSARLSARGSEGRGAPRPDFQAVRWLETLIERHERSWRAFFDLHGVPVMAIEGEQPQESRQESVEAVLRWLGLLPEQVADGTGPEVNGRTLEAPDGTPADPSGAPEWAGWLSEYRERRPRLCPSVGVRA